MAGNTAVFGEVGNFVLLEIGGSGHLRQNCVVAFRVGVVGKKGLTLADAAGEEGVFLHGEGIAGKMLDGKGKGDLQVVAPHFSGAEGNVVNQVDGDVLEIDFGGGFNGATGFFGAVTAVQQVKNAIVEGLDTNTQSVDSQCFQCEKVISGKLFWVGFQCKLHIVVEGVESVELVDDSFQFAGGTQRRGAATEVKRVDVAAGQKVLPEFNFFDKGVPIGRFQPVGCDGVKGTIDALLFAKGNMNVDACHNSISRRKNSLFFVWSATIFLILLRLISQKIIMKYQYQTQGTCSRYIEFEIDENGLLHHVVFYGGCNGNLQGISKLVEGMKVEEVIAKLEGISCSGGPTSCPDQLANALKQLKP